MARNLFNEGRDLYDERNYAEAEKKFREALLKYPKADQSDRTAYYLITTLEKLRRVQDVRNEIEKFHSNYPSSKWSEDLKETSVEANPEEKMLRQRVASQLAGTTDLLDPSLPAVALRLLIEMNPERGIENAKDLLKANPSDPVVVANLGAIYLSNAPQAFPFLLNLSLNAAASPKVRENAFFWANRKNPDKKQVADGLMDMLAKKDNEPLVNEALFRMTFEEHRLVLDQIVASARPDKFPAIGKIYQGGSITLRSDLVERVGRLSDPRALTFVLDVAQNDKDIPVRRAAIQALTTRKNPTDEKTLEGLLKGMHLAPLSTRPGAPLPAPPSSQK
jgi:tetratricopeptide (TPR) repeat protein